MATFKAVFFKHRQKADKSWNIFIRFTHDRKVRYITTSIVVTKKDITASGKIKNTQIADKCDEIIREYRKKISTLNLELCDMSIDSIVDFIKKSKDDKRGIDFISFARKWCDNNRKKIKGINNYQTAINSFCKFMGRETVMCEEINTKLLKLFEDSLAGKLRAQSLYTSSVARIFNEAMSYYNDEENGIIRIKNTISRFKPQKQNVAEKRALEKDIVKAIYNLPYTKRTVKRLTCRRDLAKDCFILSFLLMGMNSADLYSATEFDGEYITYFRAKTKDRRNDKAKMMIRVHPLAMPLINKYKGSDSVFNFADRFSSMQGLNKAINLGLKEIGKELGIDKLQFYSARHSMATIAANNAGIDKWTVNEMLCHTDSSMKVTELYIKKDFTRINDSNFRLIDYVFGDSSK